jgi:large subunit ribosomal protein L22
MAGPKTNERPRGVVSGDFEPGTRAVLRHARVAPNKVREVLDLVRNRPVREAQDLLRFSERDAALLVGKVLASAVANAEHNDDLEPEELYVSACFADEGTTIKRWRPRARGRATRIRKRTSHITVIVSRLPQDRLERLAAHRRVEQLAARARRVAGGRRAATGGEGPSRAERRRRGRGAEEAAPDADIAEAAEAEAIVDTTAAGAEAGQEVGTGEAVDTGATSTAAEEAGIVDTEAAGAEALEHADEQGEVAEAADAETSAAADDAAKDES